jgi:PAS domain S-box-containing protein
MNMNESNPDPEGPERTPDDMFRSETSDERPWVRFTKGGSPRRAVDPFIRVLVENAQDFIFRYRFHPDPAFEYVSPAARVVTGYEPAHFYREPGLLWALVHPEDRQFFRTALEAPGHLTKPMQVRWVRADGGVLFMEVRLSPVRDGKGRLLVVEGLARNVSERRLAGAEISKINRQLADAQRLAHLGSWGWDVPADVVTWSDELYRIYGLDPRSFKATYQGFLEHVHPNDRERVDATIRKAFETKGGFEFEHQIIRADGQVRTLKARGGVETDAAGNITRMFGTGQDITEQKEAERERRRNQEKLADIERLRELDEFKSRFIGMAAHEMGNPITPIQLQLHLLEGESHGRLTPDQKLSIRILRRNVARITRLVGDLLEAARLQSGNLGLNLAKVPLDRLCQNVLESLEETARASGVHIELQAPKDATVYADGARTEQIVFNLLSNAIKFSPRGGRVRVRVDVHKDHASVSVIDEGLGMTAQQLQHLFRPFSRVHEAEERVAGGTGLGLYIARSLTELQGGRIWAESEGTGKGSVFTFTLPRQASKPSMPAPAMKVLLVEDNPGDVALTRAILDESPVQVELEAIDNGEAALKSLTKGNGKALPDLVLLDLNLPGMTGLEVLHALRADARLQRLPVVVLSGSKAESDQVSTTNLGVDGYIVKPIDVDKFVILAESLGFKTQHPATPPTN